MEKIKEVENKLYTDNVEDKVDALNKLLTIRRPLSLQKRLEYAESLILLLPSISKIGTKLQSLRNISIVFLSTGKQETAINYGLEAIKIAADQNNSNLLAFSFNAMANLYKLNAEHEKALGYFKKALSIMDSSKSNRPIANTYYNIGIILRILARYDDAIKNLKQSIKLREELLDIKGVVQGYKNIGEIYLELNDFKSAEPYFLACYKLKKELASPEKQAYISYSLGLIYLQLDKFEKADFYIKQTLEYGKSYHDLYLLRNTFKMLSEYYEKTDDFANAFKYQVRYSDVTDILFDFGTEKRISEIRTRYELKNKEKEASHYKHHNRQLQLKIDKATKQMMEMEKFYEVGKFSASIVHNLNNPLSSMIGGIQLLEYEFRDVLSKNLKSRKCFEIVERNSENLKSMIKSITSSVRTCQYETDIPLNLNDILQRVIEFYKMDPAFKSTVKVVLDLDNNIHSIMGQDVHFNQIFSNLIKNAFDAMESVKHKILRCSTQNYGKDRIRVIIEDNGMGILPNKVQKIFSSDFTTKAPGKGTGLGLSITKQMVESYQGEILVESEYNIGTKFIIILPVH